MRWMLLFLFVMLAGCVSSIEIGVTDLGTKQTTQKEIAAYQWYCNSVVKPAWNTPEVRIISGFSKTGYNVFTTDQVTDPSAAGFHYAANGKIIAMVQTKICNEYGISISQVFTHELAEMLVNPLEHRYVQVDDRLYQCEPCDPVENHSFYHDGMLMSDIVLPVWFDPCAQIYPGSTFDYMAVLSQPLQIDMGHMVYITKDGETHVDR